MDKDSGSGENFDLGNRADELIKRLNISDTLLKQWSNAPLHLSDVLMLQGLGDAAYNAAQIIVHFYEQYSKNGSRFDVDTIAGRATMWTKAIEDIKKTKSHNEQPLIGLCETVRDYELKTKRSLCPAALVYLDKHKQG